MLSRSWRRNHFEVERMFEVLVPTSQEGDITHTLVIEVWVVPLPLTQEEGTMGQMIDVEVPTTQQEGILHKLLPQTVEVLVSVSQEKILCFPTVVQQRHNHHMETEQIRAQRRSSLRVTMATRNMSTR